MMGPQSLLLFLVPTLSSSWGMQWNVTREASASWMVCYDNLPYTDVIVEATCNTLQFATHDKQRKARLPSVGEVGNRLMASEHHLVGSVSTVRKQDSSLKNLKRRYSEKASRFARDAESLSQMLVALVTLELSGCDLVLAYDAGYSQQAVLEGLLQLPNQQQVMYINTEEDFLKIIWKSSRCRGYFILVDDPQPLLTFANTYHNNWDYHGRFVLAGPSLVHLEAFAASKTGKNTEHIVGAVKSGTDGEWVLYMNQLYWSQGVRRVNTWRHHRFTHESNLFPDKLSDLQGAVLKVSVFMLPPCTFYYQAANGTTLYRYGVDISVIQTIATVLNFTIEFMEPPNGEVWGDDLGNGSWSGLIGQLQRSEVDIGLANLYISYSQKNIIEFSAPYSFEITCFLARTEPPLPHWQALAFPFHLSTWLAILVGVILSGPLLFLMAWCSGRCGDEMRSLQNLGFSCYYAIGMHLCEAHVSLPRMASTQVFVLFLWLYTMILTIAYSTNLKAFLIVKKPPVMMETIRDLYNSGVQVAGIGEAIVKAELSASSDPYLKGLIHVYKSYSNWEDVFPYILEGKAVYLGHYITLEYFIKNRFTRKGVSSMRIMKESYAPYSIGMGLKQHFPLKRKLDQVIGWVRESGLKRHYFIDSLRQAAVHEKEVDGGGSEGVREEAVVVDGVIPLSLEHMQGLFLITTIGWVLSLLVFLLEKTVLPDKITHLDKCEQISAQTGRYDWNN